VGKINGIRLIKVGQYRREGELDREEKRKENFLRSEVSTIDAIRRQKEGVSKENPLKGKIQSVQQAT